MNNKFFSEITNDELLGLNGGGPGGFVIGYMVGTIVGYTGAAIIAACGGTQEQAAQILLSSLTICGTAGAVVIPG